MKPQFTSDSNRDRIGEELEKELGRKKGSRVEYGRGQISLEGIQFTHSCPLPSWVLSLIRYRGSTSLTRMQALMHGSTHLRIATCWAFSALGSFWGLGSDAHATDGSVAGPATASVPSVTTSLLRLTPSFHTFYALLM